MLTIVLIRPGSTPYSEQGRIQGTLNIPLSDQGRHEVARLVGELEGQQIAALYYAPCDASRESAERVGTALRIKAKMLEPLHNLDLGLWQGLRSDEIKKKNPKVYRQWQDQPQTVCPPEGETLAQAQARVAAVLRKLAKKHKDSTVGLVLPEPVASIVRLELNGGGLDTVWRQPGAPATWEIIGPVASSSATDGHPPP